jgi:hypothetical protein
VGEVASNGATAVSTGGFEPDPEVEPLVEIALKLGIPGCSFMSRDELMDVLADKTTVKQLQVLCRERGISRYSKLKKAELVKVLSDSTNFS